MNDYISREAIIRQLEEEIEAGNVALDEDIWINKGLQIALKDIKTVESVDIQLGISGTDFCPCCGARMMKDGDTE